MSDIQLRFEGLKEECRVELPASKSISNRVLIINALSGASREVNNLAKCDDTDAMVGALQSIGDSFNIGHAGTAMRFLTAYLAQREGVWHLGGSARMEQRPIGVLVDALRELGANIEYTKNQGFPPLKIYGCKMEGGRITVPASVSSQYISALMMIAPNMKSGLQLTLDGHIASRPYIDMTASIMREFGANVEWVSDNVINIGATGYSPVQYSVEADWSAASYIFQIALLIPGVKVCVPDLYKHSLQGDSGQVELWQRLGVQCTFTDNGVEIIGNATNCSVKEDEVLNYDFTLMPDLVQTFVVTCCLKGIRFDFSGVETLRIKETDRIAALINELAKLGCVVKCDGDSRIYWDGERCETQDFVTIETYRDHRMAMAFAPVAIVRDGVVIADSQVVTKSFPEYWREVDKLGIRN